MNIIQLPAAAAIKLNPGEHYAGPLLDAEGNVMHHVVLLPDRPNRKVNWQVAMYWAASVGGRLPNRQEQALLYANCSPHLQPDWYWSSERHGSTSIWCCDFSDGRQNRSHERFENLAVAVRILELT